MYMIQNELKAYLEANTSTLSFPLFIPETEKLPCTAYTLEGATRHRDSELSSTSVVEHVYTIQVCDVTYDGVVRLTNDLINIFDMTAFKQGDVEVLQSQVDNVTDSTNHDLSLYFRIIRITLIVNEV